MREQKIRGYVARDFDGTLHFFSSEFGDGEPCYDSDTGTWGIATGECLDISNHSGDFGDVNYYDQPVPVELIIKRV